MISGKYCMHHTVKTVIFQVISKIIQLKVKLNHSTGPVASVDKFIESLA